LKKSKKWPKKAEKKTVKKPGWKMELNSRWNEAKNGAFKEKITQGQSWDVI
jgi:hypothetical protein